MKLAFATLATTIALATGASAMVGPYERAVNENQEGLFTEGQEAQARSESQSNSPAVAHTGNGKVTIFRLRSGKAQSSSATDVPSSPSAGR